MEKQAYCSLSKKQIPISELVNVSSIREQIKDLIKSTHPDWDSEKGYISMEELNKFRHQYIESLITEENKQISDLDKKVIESIRKAELVSKNINAESDEQLSFGEKLSDKVAEFGGSWYFIISFGLLLFLWILANVYFLQTKAFDPYPFILLNLILSTIAALQAPVIMMSQNRQEAKDRIRSQNDYQVNLKAEFPIRLLHKKIDHLLIHQTQKLLEVQQIQMELIEQFLQKK